MKRTFLISMIIALLLPLGAAAADNLYCYFSKSKNTLIFYYDDLKSQRTNSATGGDKVYEIGGPYNTWDPVRETVEYIAFDESFGDASIAGLGRFFKDCHNLKSIINFKYFNGRNCTDWSYLFYNCRSLKQIDFSEFYSGPAANWSHMFDGCMALEKIIGFQYVSTSSATDMSYMFNNCINLTYVDMSNMNTSKVTNMSYMFANCQSMTRFNVGTFNTANVTDMSYMFNSCESTTTLLLTNFNTSKVTNMHAMFSGCSEVKTIDVSSFDVSKVKNFTFMFSSCPNLATIYGNCDWTDYASGTINAGYMFDGDAYLRGGQGQAYNEDWGINQAHPDVIGRPGAFTTTSKAGLLFNGHLLTAANVQKFAKSGTVTWDPEEWVLTLNNAVFEAEGGFLFPYNQSLSIYVSGSGNKISTVGTGIEGGDIFPAATTEGAKLTISSSDRFGIEMIGHSALSGDEQTNGKILELDIFGYRGAIQGARYYSSGTYTRPSIILGDMILSLSSGNRNVAVISNLEEIYEKNIKYSYDTYYFNAEKGAVYDCGVRPNGDGEGVLVTKPFKMVPKDKLVRYEVNLGGNWLNNYNSDDFNPMSLWGGKINYTPDSHFLKISGAKFSTAYVPYDELYALYAEGNFFMLSVEGNNDLAGNNGDYSYGLSCCENEDVGGMRMWGIIGTDNSAQLSLRGEIYFQSLGDENTALASIVDTKIIVADEAYFWQQDDVDVRITNCEFDLTCDKWPTQNVVEYLNSLTLEGCALADGCYFDAAKGCVKDNSGQPATGRVRILRSSSGRKGDVNGDGKINSADVVAVYNYIQLAESSGVTKTKADVNGDGVVNSADVVAIYNIIING